MATVKMVKNGKYADIYDSPETIATATKQGYKLVSSVIEEVETEVKNETTDDVVIEEVEIKKVSSNGSRSHKK